jgi:hypothetical protein
MKYQVTKLDRRHAWHGDFAYMIEFSKDSWLGTGVLNFDRCRRWFNEKFGWSQDVETRSAVIRASDFSPDDYNLDWAYSAKYREYRIYVKDAAVLNWFIMSHPNAA